MKDLLLFAKEDLGKKSTADLKLLAKHYDIIINDAKNELELHEDLAWALAFKLHGRKIRENFKY
jgi:hypothetical protein